ncbi:MAG: tRNA (adenosine(37)-N6)-threonylcarbamoyltransferase complex ATPase subunit type 1 TsaE [Synechococcaceae cyanobacterium]|jgi:tRNA threonylcarbamoyladenosine biosynthesis protein TsaE
MSQIDAPDPENPQGAWLLLPDAEATQALGRRLAALLPPGSLLLLQGDLGAGKTSLVQGLAQGLGIEEPITSPSFALAQHYSGRRPDGSDTALVHLDLYRLEDPAAAAELFAQEEEEALALGAVLAVEWPQRLRARPEPAWHLELTLADRLDPAAGRRARLLGPADDQRATAG